ncbi:MAG: ribosome maturation factor [Treponema sp.]|nr:ribosome maturation factor [Treponema sp.]
MEYKSPETLPYFAECRAVAMELGFSLVELQVVPQKGNVHVTAVIAAADPSKDIGVSDCGKVHRALYARLPALLGKDEDSIYMEVCSPGLERNIKNAWEFSVFNGKKVRVWDKNISDWVHGTVLSSSSESVELETEEGKRVFLFEEIAKAKFFNM